MTGADVAFPAHTRVPEPLLRFHPERASDQHVHPLLGLLEFGPYSRSLLSAVLDPLRVALVAPHGRHDDLRNLLKELEDCHAPRERKSYLPKFLGFSRIFGVRVVEGHAVEQTLNGPRLGSLVPHRDVANELSTALSSLVSRRSEFDVALVLLPQDWEMAFEQPEEDFDLHDYLKATAAQLGIPTQVIGDARNQALHYHCRCSVAWRLGIALYVKAGGVPWKLADAPEEAAYVGLSYSLRSSGGEDRFVTCCSQVFDADGAGLEFVAYETEDFKVRRRNPYLSRAEMRRVMARSHSLYQRRHAGRSPKKVTIYKSLDFQQDEVEGCLDSWPSTESLELLQVQRDTIWRGIDIHAPKTEVRKKGEAASYPCDRGICLPIGDREILLWTQGNATEAVDGRDYFKEGKGIPSPLLIKRFAGHGGWTETSRTLLGLTKMNWNNDGLYDRLPVTLSYAHELANIAKRMHGLSPRPYQVRFFM